MTSRRVDVAIVGAGLMGACAAWQLTRRGLSVALIEAFDLGHSLGSSHGRSRIFRRAYPDPLYVAMSGLATEKWQALEEESGTMLVTGTGGLDHGVDRNPTMLADMMGQHGVDHELLSPTAAMSRWPGMRFDTEVMFHPCSGVIDAESTIFAAASLAAAGGAEILPRTRIVDANPAPTGEVTLRTSTGDQIVAGVTVLTAGAWLPDFAGALLEFGRPDDKVLPPLTIRQQQVFHFPMRPGEPTLPTFVHKDGRQMYGLSSGADVPVPAMKVGRFDDGVATTADTRDGRITDEQRRDVIDYVREWLPGVEPEPIAEASCLFTMTGDEDFILDRSGPLVVASPCSGHGAKFAPLIGSMIADLVTGQAQPAPRFRMDRGAGALRSSS
jgi:sarcosine oxidase